MRFWEWAVRRRKSCTYHALDGYRPACASVLNVGIPPNTVRHLTFTFSGNAPSAMLTASLQSYAGAFPQWSVGLHVDGHPGFVSAVYDRVIANAKQS